MRKIALIICCTLAGCATSTKVTYSVDSTPPGAQVDVNGVMMGNTPTTITLQCAKQWVGMANAPGGWANASGSYEVTVYPLRAAAGQSQTKRIDPCQWSGAGSPMLNFDLGLERVAPTQKLEVITKQAP